MANKKITIFVGILALIALAMIFLDPEGSKPRPQVNVEIITGDQMSKLNEIQIKDDDKSLAFKKDPQGVWMISTDQEFPASASKVFDLVEKVSKLKVIREVGNNKEQWPELELDKAKMVEFKGEGFHQTLYLGKNRSGGGQFIRLGDGDKSYLVDPSVYLDLTAANWEYKTILALKPDEVKTVTFKGASPSFSLSRDNKEAKFALADLDAKEKLKEADAARLKDILADLTYTNKAPLSPAYQEALAKTMPVEIESFAGNHYAVKIVALEVAKPESKSSKKEDKADKADKAPKPAETERKYYLYAETNDPNFSTVKNLMAQWQFEISEYVANNFRKERRDYVEESKASAG